MPLTRKSYDTTRKYLFGKEKVAVEKETGITVRTQQNWERDPTTMKAQGMAQIMKARNLTEKEIMMVLKDLAL